jgi:excinuclease ABC subunit C
MFRTALELESGMDAALAQVPSARGVFAVFSADAAAEPYISQTANLRRRLQRLLGADGAATKRLNLRDRAARVEYSATGSPLESLLLLYAGYRDPRRRLKLRAPPLLRFAMENAYPRVYPTARLNMKAAENFYGPFASRVAAESYLDAVLDLFLLRRCQPDLVPDPAFPGCIYSEMHKCLAPCFQGCSDQRYAEEAQAVRCFLDTGGEALMKDIAAQRDAASAALDFEKAAALHERLEKVKTAAHLAPELARPLPSNQAILVERSAREESVTLFLFTDCRFFGPVEFATFGMRHGNEQSQSSSLFVQPVQLAPVPLEESGATAEPPAPTLEQRLREAIEQLAEQARRARPASSAGAGDHLALLRRWFYRPENQKTGEIFFAQSSGPLVHLGAPAFPLRRILRGVSRVFTGQHASRAKPLQAES